MSNRFINLKGEHNTMKDVNAKENQKAEDRIIERDEQRMEKWADRQMEGARQTVEAFRRQDVAKAISKAKEDTGSIHLIYLDRYGNVRRNSEETDDFVRLLEGTPGPFFEVCTVGKDGEIMSKDGDVIESGDTVALQEAIDNAIGERNRILQPA